MKRFATACALALAVTAISEGRASAGCKFNFSIGCNISFECDNCSVLWGLFKCGPYAPSCFPNCCYPGYGYPAYGYYGHGYDGAPAHQHQQPTGPAPTPKDGGSGMQQAGYFYGSYPVSNYGYNYSYNYGYAPAYWYGY